MPKKIKDAEGNEIEVLTQEDFDTALSEKLEAQRTEMEEAFKSQLESLKPEEKEPEPEPRKPDEDNNEPPEWFKPYADKVDRLSGNQSQTYLTSVINGLDADKKKEVNDRFEKLTGYEETPEGLQQRAVDAYTLVFGERPDTGEMNMANIASVGSGKSHTDDKKQPSESDVEIQKSLGISEEDVKKYGN